MRRIWDAEASATGQVTCTSVGALTFQLATAIATAIRRTFSAFVEAIAWPMRMAMAFATTRTNV